MLHDRRVVAGLLGDSMMSPNAYTDEGLRGAVRAVTSVECWDGPLGRLVVEQFRGYAVSVARRVGAQPGAGICWSELADDITGRLWEAVALRPHDVTTADRPWGVVATILAVAARGELLSAAYGCNARTARRYVTDDYRQPARLDMAVLQQLPAAPVSGPRWDAGLEALHAELVTAGAPTDIAAEAIEAAIDLLGESTRRSWVHTRAYRNEHLCALLERDQIKALLDLLIGSRRDGPAGSAWLALHNAARRGRPPRLAEVHPQSLRRVGAFVAPWQEAHLTAA